MKILLSSLMLSLLAWSFSAYAGEGMLVFKTQPPDVEVYIDGEFKGKANQVVTLDIAEGEHQIKIVKGEQTTEQRYFVPAGGLVKVELALQETNKKSDSIRFNFVDIPAGSFEMGSEGDDAYDNEKPVHTVHIKAFKLMDAEVTVGQYRQFIEATGYHAPSKTGYKEYSYAKSCNWNKQNVEDHPINCVSWEDVQAYISWLNMQVGKPMYRLPTEAEWEYAARAGTDTQWACGDNKWCVTQMAWFYENSDGRTHPVKTKSPNYWKLYDMHGNVWEWVQDRWHDNYEGAPTDGSAWNTGSGGARVLRGGSWFDLASNLRSANRGWNSPTSRNSNSGFRLALGQD